MKKIAIFGIFAIALLACIGFTACNNDVVETPEPETYTVKLGWSGEINVSYEPLTRAETDDLYGIQVYSKHTSDASANWTPYACGVYDNPDNITITLQRNYVYKFAATMVKDGKNKIEYRPYINDGYYMAPIAGTLENKFNYGGETLNYVGSGWSNLINGNHEYANFERFYGELTDYIPNESNTNAKIEMKRTSFGAKFTAGGKLAVDGTLEIQMKGNEPKMLLTLTEGEDIISDIFTFNKVRAAWAEDDYTETINVIFNWNRTDGTVQPLGTHAITFKRNTTTIIEVNIDKDGNDEGVDLDIPNSETGALAEGNTVTINDGEMQ